MQKISAYYIPNRIELTVGLEPHFVEYKSMYQRPIKIYRGIDNVIEFDIKNSDQKRVDLSQFSLLEMTLMDATNHEVGNNPYEIIPDLSKRGIGTVMIADTDLDCLSDSDQFLKYKVVGIKDRAQVILYANTNFNSIGIIELSNEMLVNTTPIRTYNTFTAEIDLLGRPIYHSSAIPTRFYEAVNTKTLTFDISVTGFTGNVWLDATTSGTITNECFKAAGKPFGSWGQDPKDGLFTGTIPYGSYIPIEDYTYFRVSFQTPNINGVGASFLVERINENYQVSIRNGGTGYSVGSQIRVPGSHLGGKDTINDLFITVVSIDSAGAGPAPSSYTISSIRGITHTGTAASGTGTHIVSGVNYSGVVEKIIVR